MAFSLKQFLASMLKGDSKAVLFVTTAERDAILIDGRVVFNTDTVQFEKRIAGVWTLQGMGSAVDAVITQATGGTYPTPSPNQLALSLRWIGWNYPTAKRPQDIFEQIPPKVVQNAFSNITNTAIQVNWNALTFLDELGASQTYYTNDIEIDFGTNINFTVGTYATYVASGSATSYTVTGLSAGTTYYARVRARQNDSQLGVYVRSLYDSATISGVTTGSSIFGSLLATAIAPRYAFDFRPANDTDTTVPNQGAEATVPTGALSGTFTKNIGLVAGASAQFLANMVAQQLGNGGHDFCWVLRFNIPDGLAASRYLSALYSSSATTNRLRIRNGAIDDGLKILGRRKSDASEVNTTIGTTQTTPFPTITIMILKIGNTVEVYEQGSITIKTTFTVNGSPADDYTPNRIVAFTGAPFLSGVATGLEIEYITLHHATDLSSIKSALITAMQQTP